MPRVSDVRLGVQGLGLGLQGSGGRCQDWDDEGLAVFMKEFLHDLMYTMLAGC